MKHWRHISAAAWPARTMAAALLALPFTLGGCAAGSIAGAAMELVGIRKPPELPELQKPPRKIAIHLHAGGNLNAGADGQPLALAARIYKLRQSAAFERAAYSGFLNPQTERELLGADLLEVKEVQLIPGQRYEAIESVSREASHIGIVALFRNPAAQRWRAAFSASEAEQSGITIGLHACALTVRGQPLLGTRCQP